MKLNPDIIAQMQFNPFFMDTVLYPGGVLGYISDRDVERPFFGLKFSAWDFFWV